MATKPIDYDSFLSSSGKLRQPSPIRAIQPLLSIPGMVPVGQQRNLFTQISLGGGLPNPSLFPFKSLEFTVEDTKIALTNKELSVALQYSGSVQPIYSFLTGSVWTRQPRSPIKGTPEESSSTPTRRQGMACDGEQWQPRCSV